MRIQKWLTAFSVTIVLFTACDKNDSNAVDANSSGIGGSLARFTISGNYLYLADITELRVYDISNPASPVEKPRITVGSGIETIFPYKDKLFLGSNQGMYVYSIADPANPVKLGSVLHIRSCDPVVANDSISYTTLQGGTRCGPAESGLYIYDIKNITNPVLKKMFSLTTPYGLAVVDSVAFVCQGINGLSAINVKDPLHPVTLYTRTDGAFRDVIPYNDMLIFYVQTGIMIYDASDLRDIKKIGTVNY